MKFDGKFPTLKRSIEIKQLNLSALFFANKVLGVIGGYADQRPCLVYAELFHPRLPYKKLPGPVLCNVEIMYRVDWTRNIRYMVTAYHCYDCYGIWSPMCNQEVWIHAENRETKEVVELIGRTNSEGDFKLEEESRKLWLDNVLKIAFK